jgi:hypothetical protein
MAHGDISLFAKLTLGRRYLGRGRQRGITPANILDTTKTSQIYAQNRTYLSRHPPFACA